MLAFEPVPPRWSLAKNSEWYDWPGINQSFEIKWFITDLPHAMPQDGNCVLCFWHKSSDEIWKQCVSIYQLLAILRKKLWHEPLES